jgi:hypothetical protein
MSSTTAEHPTLTAEGQPAEADLFADLRREVTQSQSELSALEGEAQAARAKLVSTSGDERRKLVDHIHQIDEDAIPSARAVLAHAQRALQTAELRSTIDERQADFDRADAALAALVSEADAIKQEQLTSLDADRLLILRGRADEMQLRLTAARLTAKQAELALVEVSRPLEGANVRCVRMELDRLNAAQREIAARKLALMREGSMAQDALQQYNFKLSQLRSEAAQLTQTLRDQSTSQERRKRRGTLGFGANG